MESTYWALAAGKDITEHIKKRKDEYWQFLSTSGVLEELQRSYKLFYGNSAIDEMNNGKTVMSVNHYASLVRSLHNIVTQNRPAFEARAVNSDYESQAVTLLANGLLDYYLREKRLEDNLKEACMLALYLREGWITAEWDSQLGQAYGVNPESGTPIMEGDVSFETRNILEIIRPATGAANWYIIRKQINRFDLIAKFPELETELLEAKTSIAERRKWSLSYIADVEINDDDCELLVFYHAKTPAMPEGRMVECVGDVILTDGPLPYKRPYIFSIKAMNTIQTGFGHSPAMDLMPLQNSLDTCFSVALSNINSFGVGTLVSEKGSLSVSQIREGLQHLEHNKGSEAPHVLNMLQIPPEVMNFASSMVQNAETISGVNSVARGNVEHQMSGTAMALVAQQALTFSSNLQASYNGLIENVGSALIELLQTYAVVPRVAQIAGKSKKSFMREFKGDDLQGINKIVVDSANAFTKTNAGKVEVANNLLNTGLIKNAEQYLQVIQTGTLEPLLEHETAQLMLIREENEALSEGGQVVAIMTDDHPTHVLEHAVVLSDPMVRSNPQITQAALAHIQQHIDLASNQSPVLAAMLKQQNFAPPPGPGPGVNPGIASTENPQSMMDAQTPAMPTIAGTDQKFDPQGQQQ